MCGITGYIEYGSRSEDGVLDKMTDSLQHRGPDGRGIWIKEQEAFRLGLGHRRLSIIDLSEHGHQPMHFKELSLVFNGEIYNYAEIKQELESDYGCHFASHSDTEVILQAFYQWGIQCVDKFIGMFAIALYDARDKKLYLIRDRAGVKPVFYYEREDVFLFASELKAFHKHPAFKKEIDKKALGFYLQYGYVAAPHCIFKDAKKVLPGHYLVYEPDKRTCREKKYWDVYDHYNKPKLQIGYEEAQRELEKILHSSFKYRMVSDVPVGVFLSGGYDSSAVAALLQKDRTERIKTFTIGFNEQKYNEAKYAKQVADYLGTDHTEYYCTERDALDIVPGLPEYFDEPFGDASAIPTTLVSRLARQQVTVALSADGGDEAFAGYTRYHNMQRNLERINRIPQMMHKPAGKLLRLVNGENESTMSKRKNSMLADILAQGGGAESYYKRSLKMISNSGLKELADTDIYENTAFNPPYSLNGENNDLEKVLAIDYQTFLLDDILVKVDRATMSVSLEGREPLLDHRIIEFAAQLPVTYKYSNGIKKRILRDITHQYLPKDMMDRPKMGFGIPLAQWLRTELKEMVNFYLNEKRIGVQGILDVNTVNAILKSFYNGEDVDAGLIWYMLMFQMWHERWM